MRPLVCNYRDVASGRSKARRAGKTIARGNAPGIARGETPGTVCSIPHLAAQVSPAMMMG